jgi:hypothetical protein
LLSQLPALTAFSSAASLPPAGALVKFRALVQDTGLGSELYRAAGKEEGQLYMYGAEEQASGNAVSAFFPFSRLPESADARGVVQDTQPEDYSKLRERQIFYVVSVPGETDWVKEVSHFLIFAFRNAADFSLCRLQTLDKTSVAGSYSPPSRRVFH